MKKKGFTLIELLAVIVILAIIALIATPIVLNIIGETKESATLRSAELYLGSVEQTIVAEMMDGNKIEDGTYEILDNGNICLKKSSDNKCETVLKVKLKGNAASEGTVKITSGKIESANLKIDNKLVKKENNEIVYAKEEDKEPVFKGKLTYSEESSGFLLDSMIDFNLIKPKTNYKITLTDSNKETIVIDNLALYAIEGMSLLSKAAEDYYPMLMCSSEAGACAFMYEPLNPEQEYQVTLEEQGDEFIPYQFAISIDEKKAYIYFATMNVDKGWFFDILIKDEYNNIYINETKIFNDATYNLIGTFSYEGSVVVSSLKSLYDAIKDGKKITMTLSYYDLETGKLNGLVDEHVFELGNAICAETNSMNDCISYGWGNPNLFILD